ncbi:hypothetical protein TRFO_12099 [Tritrichomonas foetus]|uniref:Uncharacterized protein n=1 Tax=Tritrichomonas foetus TaxID=1144522 RepID=A0A1J4J6L1_9EUKA|nr:hypothetical protein TRFO_12099 [Tritrichomonas foetus]|eukprot:OHS93077.1 hypothetical protein TRFO_12099 [Tritrichomonas foetus]
MQDDCLSDLDRDGLLDEIARVNEVNRQVQSEMKVLKEQYDEAIKFTFKIEEYTDEIKNLKKQVSDSRLVVDDLQRRLQISQQLNAELSNVKESIKANVGKQYSDEVSDLQMQLGIAKSENVNLNTRFQQQMKEIETTLHTTQSENALYQKQLSKILFFVGNYFHEKFETPQELINKLSNSPQLSNNNGKDIFNNNNEENAFVPKEVHQNKINNLKSQYQNEKQKRKEMQIAIMKLKKKIEQDALDYEDQITNLKDQVSQQSNEINRLELLNQQNILKNGAPPPPKRRSKGIQNSIIAAEDNTLVENYRHQLANANTQNEAQETNIAMLKMQIESMVKQVEDSETSKALMNSKMKQISRRNEEAEKELKIQKNDNEKLISKIHELQDQIKQSEENALLPTTQLESKIKIMETNLNNKQLAVDNLEKVIVNQKKEIGELHLHKENLIMVIERQNQMLNLFDELCQRKVNNPGKVIEKVITVEPKFKWAIEKLPPEIVDIIQDISENDAMSLESRIKNVIIVINKWIDQNENAHMKKLEQCNQAYKKLDDQFEAFKNDILEACDIENIDISQLKYFISDAIQNVHVATKELNDLKENEASLLEATESSDIYGVIEKFREIMRDNSQLLEKFDNERKKRILQKKKFLLFYNEREKDFNQKAEINQKSVENARKQIEQLQNSINSLQQQNKSLIEQMKNEANKIQQERQKEEEYQNNMENQHEHHNQLADMDLNDMSRTQAIYENEELQYQIRNLEKTSNIWKEAAQKAADENTRLQNQIKEIKEDYETQIKQLNNKHEIENIQNNKTVQEMSNKLKSQADDSKVALDKVNENLINLNRSYECAMQEIANLKYEIDKNNLSNEAKIESIERSKKLSEAQLKAKILSIDSNYAMLLEDEKQKAETDKRELIEYFMKSFRRYSDINIQMNEESFCEVVRKVRAEFEKHQKTEDAIRKLIKADEDDSIEDALTQFIIQNHPQFQMK